jgi:cytoskeletal protein CcmA (bactofilin family)
MLSNFASRKSQRNGIPASANGEVVSQTHTPPPAHPVKHPYAAAQRASERPQTSVIGPDLTIQGSLTSNGQVQVDGEVQGDVFATHVLIGENARITGGIIAQEIVVRGYVMGFVRGHKVMLQATSHVEGDVLHRSLAIEQGAYFEGKSRRSENPLQEQGAGSDNEAPSAPQLQAQPQVQQAAPPRPQVQAANGPSVVQAAQPAIRPAAS